MVIGYQFGTSFEADSIITAYTIPNFFYIVLGGAITTTVISIASKLQDQKQKEFIDTITSGLVLFMGSLTILLVIFAESWITLFFKGLSSESLTLTVQLFQWMAPATFFLVLSMLYSGLLNMHEKYRLTSFSTLIFNALFLSVSLLISLILGPLGYGLGALASAFSMFLFLIYFLRRFQIISRFNWRLTYTAETKRFMQLLIPIVLGGATLQFYYLIQRIFASGLDAGMIASLNYASKLTQFPQAVLMASVTTVIYPLLSKAAGDQDLPRLKRVYQKGVQTLFVLLIPVTIALMLFAEDAVILIFQYGNFDAAATERTYPLLQLLSWTMVGLAMNTYITRFFYALERSVLPIILNIISVFGINILLVQLLINNLGVNAIAIAMVVSTLINTVMLMILAYQQYRFSIASIQWLTRFTLFSLMIFVIFYGLSILPISIVIIRLLIVGLFTLATIGIGFKMFVGSANEITK